MEVGPAHVADGTEAAGGRVRLTGDGAGVRGTVRAGATQVASLSNVTLKGYAPCPTLN